MFYSYKNWDQNEWIPFEKTSINEQPLVGTISIVLNADRNYNAKARQEFQDFDKPIAYSIRNYWMTAFLELLELFVDNPNLD